MRFSSNTVLDSLASVKTVVLWRRIIRKMTWGLRAGVSAEPGSPPPPAPARPRRPSPHAPLLFKKQCFLSFLLLYGFFTR